MKTICSVRTIILAASLLLQLSPLCFHSRGAAGDVDLSFDPGSAVNGANFVTAQPDGKVLVAGPSFIIGTNYYRIARLNGDGSLDGSFTTNGYHPDDIGDISSEYDYVRVTAWAGQSDGKMLFGGYTVHYDCDPEGCTVYRIWFLNRVNANGSRDTSFNPYLGPLGSDPWLDSIVVQSDGKVLVRTLLGMTRFNANGSTDAGFIPSTPGSYSVAASVTVQSDGKLIIGGSFTNVNGTSRNGIARINTDGSLDGSFNPGTGVSGGSVSSIALQPDGKVLIGGWFTDFNGTNCNRIARLNTNGSLDSSFSPGIGADGIVTSVALQADGKVLIGGGFTIVNGVARSHVARLYGDAGAPSLNIARSNAFVIVSWPVSGLNFQLQETTDLALPNSWSPVAQPTVTNAGQISVTVPTTVARKFFQLKSQ